VASSVGKAYVEVEANAEKVGPELERRFGAALATIADAAADTFDDVGDESSTAARLIGEAFEEQGQDAARSLGQLGDAMTDAGGRVVAGAQDAAAGITDALRDGANRTDQALEPIVDNAKKAGEKAGDAAGEGFGTKAKLAIAGAATAVGAIIGTSIAGSIDTEVALDKLNAQLGASGAYAADLGKIAGQLYVSNYGENLGEVSDALRTVIQSGAVFEDATNEQLQSVTASVLDLSTAFDKDVGETSQAVGRLIQTGMAKDAGEALDLITRGFQQGADRGGDFLDVIGEYGTTFQEVGLDGGSAIGLINQALAAGIPNADFAADAVREMGIIMREGGEDAASALNNLGLDSAQIFADFQAGGPAAAAAMDKVFDALRNTEDPAARSAAATALIGTQYEDLGDAILSLDPSEATRSLGQIDGAAAALGTTLNDNAASNIESFKRQLSQTFVDLIGNRVLPFVSNLASTLATQFGPTLQLVGGFIAGTLVPALIDAGTWIRDNATAIGVVVGVIAAIFLPHLIALAAAYVTTKVQAVAAWTVQKAQAIAGAAAHSLAVVQMIARWIALAAQAVISAAVIGAQYVAMAAGAVASAAATAAAWVGAQIRTVASLVAMAAGFAVQGAVMLASMAATVAGVVGGWIVMGAQSLLGAAKVAAAWLIAMGPIALVIAAVVAVIAVIVANWETIKNATAAAWNAVVGFITGAVSGAYNAVVNGFNTVVGFVSSLPGRILSALGSLGSLLLGAGRDLMQGLVNGIANAAGFVGNVGKNIVNSVIRFINSNVIDRVNDLLEFTIAGITINPPDIPRIPQLADGAIVNRPTLAVIGEDGPEVVVPLSQRRRNRRNQLMDDAGLTGGGSGMTIDARQYYTVQDTQTAQEVGAVVGQRVVRDLRNGITSPYAGATA
jgi:phage-related minor tail protein